MRPEDSDSSGDPPKKTQTSNYWDEWQRNRDSLPEPLSPDILQLVKVIATVTALLVIIVEVLR